MICGLAFSRLSACGVSSVAPGLVICEATTLVPVLAREALHVLRVAETAGGVVLDDRHARVMPGDDELGDGGQVVGEEDVADAGERVGGQVGGADALARPARLPAEQDLLQLVGDRHRGAGRRRLLRAEDEVRVDLGHALAHESRGRGRVGGVVLRHERDLVAEHAAGLVDHGRPGGRPELVVVAELGEGPDVAAISQMVMGRAGRGAAAAARTAPGRQAGGEDRAGSGATQDLQPGRERCTEVTRVSSIKAPYGFVQDCLPTCSSNARCIPNA